MTQIHFDMTQKALGATYMVKLNLLVFLDFVVEVEGLGYGPFLLITLHIYINAMMHRVYGNDVYVYVIATFISLLYQFLT